MTGAERGLTAPGRSRPDVLRIRAVAAEGRTATVVIADPGRQGRFGPLFDLVVAGAEQGAVSADSLCRTATTRLGIAAAAVSVPGKLLGAQTVGAAGSLARRLEELQVVLGEGPSLDGLAGGVAALVDDLAAAERQAAWPLFAPAALDAGVLSLYVLPMRLGAARFGVLALYLDRSGGLDAERLADGRAFAAIALELLLDCTQIGATGAEPDPIGVRAFLDDRPEIHQATGMVSVQLDVDLGTALLRIRARAFAESRLLSEIAADVVTRKVRFRAHLDDAQDDYDGREIQ